MPPASNYEHKSACTYSCNITYISKKNTKQRLQGSVEELALRIADPPLAGGLAVGVDAIHQAVAELLTNLRQELSNQI